MIVSDEMSGRVAKIILLPKGDGSRYVALAQAPVSTTEEGLPETESQSFEFEFDPNAAPVDDPEVQRRTTRRWISRPRCRRTSKTSEGLEGSRLTRRLPARPFAD